MTESEHSKPIEEQKPAAGAEEKKDEEEQPIRFTKEKICERTLTWQEKLDKLGGYDKLGDHDKLLVDLGREEEEDEKKVNSQFWCLLPNKAKTNCNSFLITHFAR